MEEDGGEAFDASSSREKYGEEPARARGRPSKRKWHTYTRSVSGVRNRLVANERFHAFAAGLRYAARAVGADLDEMQRQWATRGIEISRIANEPAGRCMIPEGLNVADVHCWVAGALSSPGKQRCTASKPIVVPRKLYDAVNDGKDSAARATVLQQISLFVQFVQRCNSRAASVAIEAGPTGLSLVSAQKICADTTIALAEFDGQIQEEETGLLFRTFQGFRAAVLGPAALADGGCIGCANVRLVGPSQRRLVPGGEPCNVIELKTLVDTGIPHAGVPILILQETAPEGKTWLCRGCGNSLA